MKTDYLFARPSFLSGMARLGNLFGGFDDYNSSPSGSLADARAIYSDWRMVGEDLARAMAGIEAEEAMEEAPADSKESAAAPVRRR